jgi:hypothetical protein
MAATKPLANRGSCGRASGLTRVWGSGKLYSRCSLLHMNSKQTGRVIISGLWDYSMWGGTWTERI